MIRRILTFGLSFVALCLIAGTVRYYYQQTAVTPVSSVSEKTKPGQISGIEHASSAPQSESIQQPTAEVLSNRITEYHINVKLDEQEGTLSGSETLTWTHPGKKAVNELYLHLYPNAFESSETTFMKESGGKLRSDAMPKDGWGAMELTEIRTTDGISLLHRVQYIQPDDGNPKDRTLARVRLPISVHSGETVTLKIKFTVKLPKVFARMGKAGDFVMAGQWFPKLSVYEPAGTRGRATEGWNLHQYHGSSEFYSDFGIYSVMIDVPEDYTVAATGFPTKSTRDQNGRKLVHYYADDVHDFAWAASPNFIYAEEPFSSDTVPGVRIKLYLDPLHKDLKERYFYAAKVALANFSKWYGRYPYSTLSIVVPPADANGAGGMEYPTLVTSFGAKSDSPDYNELERTIIHEIAHQYFYGMIASNEFEEAWLDEGFASYAEDKLMAQEFTINPPLPVQASIITSPASLTQPAWKYGSSDAYAQNAYYRGKLVLIDIEKQVGAKTMRRIMYSYSLKYRFKHPTTTDFQRVVEQVTGRSWKEYFNQYVYSDQMADFSVDRIQVHPVASSEGAAYESVVDIHRKGANYPKITILLTFKDGHSLRKDWNVDNDTLQIKVQYKAPVDWVQIDPEYTLALENKHINNYLKAEVQEPLSTRSTLTVVKLLEIVLGSLIW
ncbi:M1 family metallopeptidase [Paenibacillus aceti]|uniref:Peptidase M1 n=1 Tax=Paenibacillus aceti TaxID=1820010 RepID=A0ABQ1W5G7_9BACL|nr:M1 family metallopeptidase [Paenibacillus aceti]GGG16013.1 peptidase M1 [Paenibacillus aceti]